MKDNPALHVVKIGGALIDDPEKYWSTDDIIHEPELLLEFENMVVFNVISLQEYLPLGQRIDRWAFDIWENDQWIQIAEETSIGNKRLWKGKPQTTNKVRLRVIESPVSPAISKIGLFLEKP